MDDDAIRTFRSRASTGSAAFLAGLSIPTWGYTDGRYDAGDLGPALRAALVGEFGSW